MTRQLILIAGESGTGKSASLMNIRDPQRTFYLSTEANKPLPFPNKFKVPSATLSSPLQVIPLFKKLEEIDEIDTIVIDSITFLMDMYESQEVLKATDTRKAWGDYQQFFKTIMQEIVQNSTKNWVFIAHNTAELTNNGTYKYYVPVKGALKNQGLEAYYSLIVYTRRVTIDELESYPYDEDLLHITERDRMVGYKHVFQCEVTKDFANSRIRSPIGAFAPNQIFMDNDVQLLMDHLAKYYGE